MIRQKSTYTSSPNSKRVKFSRMDLDDNAKGSLEDDRTPVRAGQSWYSTLPSLSIIGLHDLFCPYSLDADTGETVEVILSDGTRRSILKEALYISGMRSRAVPFFILISDILMSSILVPSFATL